jgi:hypothetical protein
MQLKDGRCNLPFDLNEVVDNLRLERYVSPEARGSVSTALRHGVHSIYYLCRPLLPVSVRKYLQRMSLSGWDKKPFPAWPVDRSVDRLLERVLLHVLKATGEKEIPFIWFWPDGQSGCVVMTHDVETADGLAFCPSLMDLDDSFDIRAAFQVIPGARYRVTDETITEIRQRGFEVNVHDWAHDGHLYSNREFFSQCAVRINQFAAQHQMDGFRSGALYRNLAWYDLLEFAYDMSVPNLGHLEPQPGGCCTIMPYFIGKILELPLTTVQDYSLWNILNDHSIDIWKRQLEIILTNHGMASFNVHPDYVMEGRGRSIYSALLKHLKELRSSGDVWCALPRQVNQWWRQRSQMQLMSSSEGWRVTGPGHERAHVAFASVDGDRLVYRLTSKDGEACNRAASTSCR